MTLDWNKLVAESREQEVEGDSIVSGCFIPERLIQLLFCAPF